MTPPHSHRSGAGAAIHGALTTLRAATEDDVDLLVEWHSDPEVAKFWDGETFTPAEVKARLERADVWSLIVEEEGTPVGYVQAWSEDGWASGGVDMFLVPRARGRGLGPDAARALARHLLDECAWSRVTVDPYVWNTAAIRAWQRAGFEAEGERPPDGEHTAPWLLMVFRD